MYNALCLGAAAPNSRHHVLENLFSGPWVSLLVCIYGYIYIYVYIFIYVYVLYMYGTCMVHVRPTSMEKTTGLRFAILPPAGQRSGKKTSLETKTRIYRIYVYI